MKQNYEIFFVDLIWRRVSVRFLELPYALSVLMFVCHKNNFETRIEGEGNAFLKHSPQNTSGRE